MNSKQHTFPSTIHRKFSRKWIVMLGMTVLWELPHLAWAAPICMDVLPSSGYAGTIYPCDSPQATGCISVNGNECTELGYLHWIDGFEWCAVPTCDAPVAGIPELGEYAAAVFLGLVVLIGWRARCLSAFEKSRLAN